MRLGLQAHGNAKRMIRSLPHGHADDMSVMTESDTMIDLSRDLSLDMWWRNAAHFA